jgi:hypothetical protein
MGFVNALMRCLDYFAKTRLMSSNALNSSALPLGSRKNIVACSPGCPLKRTWGSIMKLTPAWLSLSASFCHSRHRQDHAEVASRNVITVDRAGRAMAGFVGSEMGDDLVPMKLKSTHSRELRPSEQPRSPP